MLSVGSGTSTYYGDLKDPGFGIDPKININLGIQKFIGNRIIARFEADYFTLRGDDASSSPDGGRVSRNLSFKSSNFELSLTGQINLLPTGQRFYQRPNVNVYGFVGAGMAYINPKAEYNGQTYALQPLQTEGVKYGKFATVIPYGIGVRFKAGPFFNVAIENGWRIMFTDYLDDVSTVHPDKSSWTDPIRIALSDRGPEVGAAPRAVGSIRGNSSKNDSYHLLNIKIEYYLPFEIFGSQNRRLYNSKRKQYYRRR